MVIRIRYGHTRCVFCGSLNSKSLNLTFHPGQDGVVTTQFKADTELQGYDDILHGGVISGLLDSAMTHCLFYQGIQAVTGDLHVRFIKPVPCRSQVDIRAWLLSSSPPLYRLRAEILINNKVMAWAEAKFVQSRISNNGKQD